MAEIILHTIPYRQLPEKVKEKVVEWLHTSILNTFCFSLDKKDIGEMFDQLNTIIEFYQTDSGAKLFLPDFSDERFLKALRDEVVAAGIWDPNIKDKILVNMIKRTDGDPRLKVQ